MSGSILSIFIDELGNFNMRDSHGQLYGFTLVFHDQSLSIADNLSNLEVAFERKGLPASTVFHTALLIRRKDQYAEMDSKERRQIFDCFFSFAKHLPVTYKSFVFYKPDYDSKDQLLNAMTKALSGFIKENQSFFFGYSVIEAFYDSGQQEIAQLLRTVFSGAFHDFEFRSSTASLYRLQQVADLICTMEALVVKTEKGIVTKSEENFFLSIRRFMHTYYRRIRYLDFNSKKQN